MLPVYASYQITHMKFYLQFCITYCSTCETLINNLYRQLQRRYNLFSLSISVDSEPVKIVFAY